VGQSAEFSGEERSAGTRQRSRRREIIAGHAREPERSGSAIVQEERGGTSQAELSGTRGDGKPQRAGGEAVCDRGGDAARAGRGVADADRTAERTPGQAESGRGRRSDHGGRRQGISGARFYRGIAETGGDTPHRGV